MSQKVEKSFSILQINIWSFIGACILISGIVSVLLFQALGKSINESTAKYAQDQAEQMGLSFKNFINNHQEILKTYSEFPIIKQAAVQPESHLDDAADLLKSFAFLGQDYPIVLLDFEAEVLLSSENSSYFTLNNDLNLQEFIEEDSLLHIGLTEVNGSKYIIFGAEIIVKKSIEGAILVFIPLDSILAQNLIASVEYDLTFKGNVLTNAVDLSKGTYVTSTLDLNRDFTLRTYIKTDDIMNNQTQTVYDLIITIVAVFIVFSFISLFLVNKHLIMPIVNLKEMTQAISNAKSRLPVPQRTSIKELLLLQNDFKKMVSTLNDRTEALNEANSDLELKVKKRTEELQNKAEELEQLSKYKSEFLARMSHEIRTPMNAIIGYVDILKESQMNEEERNHLEIIHNSAEALLTIINDILDFSKIEAGMLKVEDIPFNLNIILKDIQNMFSKTADDKGVNLEVERISQENQWLSGDPHRIRQVLINLTGNALKFTKNGNVKVSIVSKVKNNLVKAQIKIEDSGIGIAEDKIDDIFKSFSQAEGSITRTFGGTGLGLPISRNLAELMGGSLTATSKLGKGSTFTLELVLQKANALEKTTTEFTVLEWQTKPLILLVEDNKVNLKLAMKTLDKLGCDVKTAINGEDALDKISTADFDLVLMDCQMPVMDGLESTRRMRKMPDYKEIPIIAFTANAMDDEIKECFEAGMNDYLTKPFKKEQFNEKLKNWLKHKLKVA